MHDVIHFAQKIIQFPSVTPQATAILDYFETQLKALNFTCHRLVFQDSPDTEPVDNLVAIYGNTGRRLGFSGHVDVVPVGNQASWIYPPFEGVISGNNLYGRGAVDMKGAIACFFGAMVDYLETHPDCSIAFLLTGDEEGPGINGTKKIVQWMQENNVYMHDCIVGEPTNHAYMGEIIKIGRRGSANFHLTLTGKQGHVAYPSLASNPIHAMIDVLKEIKSITWDEGDAFFTPTHLEITTIDVGNFTSNIIPHEAKSSFNIRFNPHYTKEALHAKIQSCCDTVFTEKEIQYTLTMTCNAEPFLTSPGALSDIVQKASVAVLGKEPILSTTGGTSDARFIKDLCPVVECGLTNNMAHKIDEYTPIAHLHQLKDLYKEILQRYFEAFTP